jgi:single-strand DNA-binding protein
MAGDPEITLVGNLVDDPELRFTPSGQAVASFRVASTPRIYDKTANEWKDGDSLFLTCNVWRQAAEHVAESLQRGMRVIVRGRLKQPVLRDQAGREAHRVRGRGRRGWAQPAQRDREGDQGGPQRRWRRHCSACRRR